MVPETVGLDDQAEVAPEKVEPEAVEAHAGLGQRQVRLPHQTKERALEIRVSAPERERVEHLQKGRYSSLPTTDDDLGSQGVGVN